MGGAVLADAVVLAAPPFRPDRTTTLGGKEKRRRAPSVAPWDDMPEEDLDLAASPVIRANGGIHGFRHEQFAGDAALFNGYGRERRPRCELPSSWSCSVLVGMLLFRGAVVRGPASVVRLFCRV